MAQNFLGSFLRSLIGITLAGTLSACAGFHEVHHLKTVDQAGRPINYYRITIDGHSGGGSARYISGFYDAVAVEKYFNEFKQPKDGAFFDFRVRQPRPAVSLRGLNERDVTDGSLVMMLSSNTDAVAQGISTLAQSEEVTRSLTLLAAKDNIVANEQAADRLEILNGQAVYLQKKGDVVILGLPDAADENATKNTFLNYASTLATLIGHRGSFQNLDEAWNWLISTGGTP